MYAIEYTAMANHARRVVQANGVDHIVTVIQGAVEDVILPEEDWDGMGVGLAYEDGDVEFNDDGRKNQRVVDIILSGENQISFTLYSSLLKLCVSDNLITMLLFLLRMDGVLPTSRVHARLISARA